MLGNDILFLPHTLLMPQGAYMFAVELLFISAHPLHWQKIRGLVTLAVAFARLCFQSAGAFLYVVGTQRVSHGLSGFKNQSATDDGAIP
jgi:hypothetical protein